MREPGDLTAILLCGGRGERLRPFTESLPKPLVPLRGRPLLEHLLRLLGGQGIRRVVLCTGYKAAELERYAAGQPVEGLDLRCVDSGEHAAMADRILDARAHAGGGPVLVCYGDTLANVSLADLLATQARAGSLATVTVYPLHSPFGIVQLAEDGLRVENLREKPVLPHWINIGFLACQPAALDRLERGTDLAAFLNALAREGSLSAHRHQGRHLTVNTEKERSDAERDIEFFTYVEAMER